MQVYRMSYEGIISDKVVAITDEEVVTKIEGSCSLPCFLRNIVFISVNWII